MTLRNASVLKWTLGDALNVTGLVPAKVEYVLMANTFHGVPQRAKLARSIAAVLRPRGLLAVINWHPTPLAQTVVLGRRRGPRTDMRLSSEATRQVTEPAGFALERIVKLPPYHYGAVFIKQREKAWVR